MNHSSSRRGQGTVLVIAALFICVMAVMQVAQSYLLTQVGDQTTRSGLGRMCALVAESAIEEARILVATRVNKRADPLFDKVRVDGPPITQVGKTFATVPLTANDLPRLKQLLATETGKNVELIEISAEFQSSRPLTLVYNAEIEGVVVYHVRTRAKIDHSIIREIEETQGFKLGQVALPAPLNRSPLYVRDPFHMLFGHRAVDGSSMGGVNANTIHGEIGRHFRTLRDKYQEVMRKFDDSNAKKSGFLQRVKPLYAKISADNGKDHMAQVEKAVNDVKDFPAPNNEQAGYFLMARPDTVELERLNLQYKLALQLPPMSKTIDDINQLAPQIQAMYDHDDESDGAYQANQHYTELMIQELDQMEGILDQIGVVQTTFKNFEASANAEAFAYMQMAFGTDDPLAMAVPHNVLAQRAMWRIAEAPGEPPIQAQWDRLRKRLDTFGGGFCGTVYVENPREVFTLAGELAGALTICVSGKLIVDGLHPKRSADVLTVVGRGGDPGAVKLSGAITASIATRGSALSIATGTTIVGTLILDEIPLGLTTGLTGVVQVDHRLDDTSKPPFFYVALSPWTRSRTTVRF